MKTYLRAAERYATVSLVVFAILNFPARMIVDGKIESWCAFKVPEPWRSVCRVEMKGEPRAQFQRGWPWAFQDESGFPYSTKGRRGFTKDHPFITNDKRPLFLPNFEAVYDWVQLSIPLFFADVAVSLMIAAALLVAGRILRKAFRSKILQTILHTDLFH